MIVNGHFTSKLCLNQHLLKAPFAYGCCMIMSQVKNVADVGAFSSHYTSTFDLAFVLFLLNLIYTLYLSNTLYLDLPMSFGSIGTYSSHKSDWRVKSKTQWVHM